MSVQISPAEYFLTVEKIEKINARAAKKGWTGRVTLDAVETTKVTNVEGFEVREQVWDVTLGGEAPSYNGWTFLATLDWDENAGLITRCAPGVEVVVERDSTGRRMVRPLQDQPLPQGHLPRPEPVDRRAGPGRQHLRKGLPRLDRILHLPEHR